MAWHFTPWVLRNLAVAAVAASLAAFAFRRRQRRGAAAIGLFMACAAAWSSLHGLELLGADVATKLFWYRLQRPPAVLLPLAWLAFALDFSGRGSRRAHRYLKLLLLFPATTLLLVATNEYHGLNWTHHSLVPGGTSFPLEVTWGPWSWAQRIFSYALLLAGGVVLAPFLWSTRSLHRWQVAALLLAVGLPVTADLASMSGVVQGAGLSSFAVVLMGLTIGWAFLRLRLLEALPVARERLIEQMRDGVLVLDAENRVADINAAACQALGCPPEQALGRPAAELLSGWPELIAHLGDQTEAELQIDLERGPVGRHYQLRIAPLDTPDGGTSGRLVVWHDVTARRQAEEERDRLARRQTLLYQVLRAVVPHLDEVQAVRLAASEIARLTGWANCAIAVPDRGGLAIHAAGADGIEDDWLPADRGVIGRALRTGQTQLVADVGADPDYTSGHPDTRGHPETRSELAVPLRWGGGTLGVLNFERGRTGGFDAEDVALAESLADAVALALDNSRLYRELGRGKERFRRLLEAAPDAMVIVDPKGCIVLVNSEAERMFGYGHDELVGQPIEMLVPDRFRGAHGAHRSSYLHGPETRAMGVGLELRALRKDGREFPVEIGLSPLETAEGMLVMSAIRDVTERRRVEELRDDLTRSLVHDLRNPLASVGSALEMLIESVPQDQSELARMALTSARRLEGLVDGILDIGRLESGQMKIRLEPVRLTQLLQEAVDAQRLIADARGLKLVAEADPELPPVSADPELVGRVLQNLVGNAVKFIQPGGQIRLGAQNLPGDAAWIEVTVSDDGPGLPAETEGRLFQKFASGSQKERGSGLGLAFCRLAVEAHGGRIRAESHPGQGASFSFTLPAAGVGVQSGAPAQPPGDAAVPARAMAANPLRVLVADDDAINRKLAAIALKRLGHSADEAADGEAVVAALHVESYDAILMDMDMPRMDGLEAARRIRLEWPTERRPRIIAVTASARREDRERCLAAGMDDFVTKPFRLDTLEAKLGRTAWSAPMPVPASGNQVASPLDPVRWAELTRLDETLAPGLIGELVDTFRRQAPLRFQEIRAAVQAGDAAGLQRTAHALKGTCGTIGATELAQLCGALEDHPDLGQAEVTLARLERELERTRAWLADRTTVQASEP